MDFICGQTVRERLRDHGALLRDADIENDTALETLSPEQRVLAIAARGTAVVPQSLNRAFVDCIHDQLNKIHSCRIAGLDIKFGNFLIDDHNQAWWVDFHKARFFPKCSEWLFAVKRDQDRISFNRLFGQSVITEANARLALDNFDSYEWYSPVDFGLGLARGSFWETEVGTGRWERFNRELLHDLVGSLQGKRILDLGSNNGVMPIMMLGDGASEVIGVELDSINYQVAKLVKEVFEWRHMQHYQFDIHNGSMLDILFQDWGKFDLITAFCSLYYLQIDDMQRVVQRAAELSPVMVLQANLDTYDPERQDRASPEFLATILKANGFTNVQICAPKNFERPMIIGRQNQ